MSISDFDSLLPFEFGEIYEQWRKHKEEREAAWLSGIRLHAAICVQPHCSKTIRPRDLFSIPMIDDPLKIKDEQPTPKLTKEEQRIQYEKLKKASGFQ